MNDFEEGTLSMKSWPAVMAEFGLSSGAKFIGYSDCREIIYGREVNSDGTFNERMDRYRSLYK